MRKLFLTLIIGGLSLGALAGCGPKSDEGTPPPKSNTPSGPPAETPPDNRAHPSIQPNGGGSTPAPGGTTTASPQ